MLRRLAPLAALAALLVAAPAWAQPARSGAPPVLYQSVDSGMYRVFYQNRPIAYELFDFTIHYDTLYVTSEYRQALKTPGDTLRKVNLLLVKQADSDFILYRSNLLLPKRPEIIRGVTPGDTIINFYRENPAGGEGFTHIRPPGRIYVVESNAYATYDLVFRDLASRRGWDRRPVNLAVVSEEDTILEVTAQSLGEETIPWGGGPVAARKYSLSDGQVTFLAWVGPRGTMLRFENPAISLRVELVPARRAAKRPAPKAPAPKPPAAKPPAPTR